MLRRRSSDAPHKSSRGDVYRDTLTSTADSDVVIGDVATVLRYLAILSTGIVVRKARVRRRREGRRSLSLQWNLAAGAPRDGDTIRLRARPTPRPRGNELDRLRGGLRLMGPTDEGGWLAVRRCTAILDQGPHPQSRPEDEGGTGTDLGRAVGPED